MIDFANELRQTSGGMSIRRIIDLIYWKSLDTDDDDKKKNFIMALKCVLLIRNLMDSNVNVIESHLKNSKIEEFDESDFENIRSLSVRLASYGDAIEFRKVVAKFCEEES